MVRAEKYKQMSRDGRKFRVHVYIAEQVLGHALPPKAQVHHLDGNGFNNVHTNLVICPDRIYHMLLHRRQRALEACGNADWLKCVYCKLFDDPANLLSHFNEKSNHLSTYHKTCKTDRQRERRKERRVTSNLS